jgi:hypothetical protein
MRCAHAVTPEPSFDRSSQIVNALEQGKHVADRTTFELSSYLAFQLTSVALWT